MEETQDQAQEGSQEEVSSIDQAPEEQSETTSESEETLYEMPDGTKVDAATLAREWKENFYPEFTKRSQRLSDYEKAEAEREARANTGAKEIVATDKFWENVDPTVRSALDARITERVSQHLQQQQEIQARQEKDREWNMKFETSEKSHDGKDGLPKFHREEVLQFMMDREIYDPETAYYQLHREVIEDNLIKNALKNKESSVPTESTGGDVPKKPTGKSPKTFEEAAKSAYDRLRSA